MKLRAFVTNYVDDKSSPRTVYEVWIYDLTDPGHPRKLPDHLGKYTTPHRAERAKLQFNTHRAEIELEQERAARENHTERDA